jgi:hypothetical protein
VTALCVDITGSSRKMVFIIVRSYASRSFERPRGFVRMRSVAEDVAGQIGGR